MEKLTSEGWKILRFSGTDIQRNVQFFVGEVENSINAAKILLK